MKITIRNGLCTARQSGFKYLTSLGRKTSVSEGLLHHQFSLRREPESSESELLPPNTRFMRSTSRFAQVVIEERPQVRNIHYICLNSGGIRRTALISLPYLVFVVNLAKNSDGSRSGCGCNECRRKVYPNIWTTQQLQCFFRTTPLRSLDDRVDLFGLSNVYDVANNYGYICLDNNNIGSGNLNDACMAIIRHFWNTTFWDLYSWLARPDNNGLKSRDDRLISYEAWAEATRDNPNFAQNVGWNQLPENLAYYMDKVWPHRRTNRRDDRSLLSIATSLPAITQERHL